MKSSNKASVWLGSVATFVFILLVPLVSAASSTDDLDAAVANTPILELPDGLSTEGVPPEIKSTPSVQSTPWGTPVQVSPNRGIALYHYPRQVTLSWNRVQGANSYRVQRAYFSGATWTAYPLVTVNGANNASYTFSFVGDQSGRWRVKACTGTDGTGTCTSYSPYWTFSFRTKPQMATPILTNPYPEEVFDHYPRTVTLSWKMVPAAAGYKLERSYCQTGKVNCVDYTPIIINDPLKAYYTIDFVGAQPGRWRVTTLGGTSYSDSAPSAWRWFEFDI
jgi:hypothetical protein